MLRYDDNKRQIFCVSIDVFYSFSFSWLKQRLENYLTKAFSYCFVFIIYIIYYNVCKSYTFRLCWLKQGFDNYLTMVIWWSYHSLFIIDLFCLLFIIIVRLLFNDTTSVDCVSHLKEKLILLLIRLYRTVNERDPGTWMLWVEQKHCCRSNVLTFKCLSVGTLCNCKCYWEFMYH